MVHLLFARGWLHSFYRHYFTAIGGKTLGLSGGVIDFAIGLRLDGILAAGMGMPPFMRFTNAGIKVYADPTEPNVGKAIELFVAGKVALMDPSAACQH